MAGFFVWDNRYLSGHVRAGGNKIGLCLLICINFMLADNLESFLFCYTCVSMICILIINL